MDIKKHDCIKNFLTDDMGISGTQVVVKGHCEICCYRMTILYRYMGTYDRDTLKKLDPKPGAGSSKRKGTKALEIS